MRFGLKEETIQKINTVFASFPEVDEAILYGSRAKGNYKPGSDIDITLKGNGLKLDVENKIGLLIDDLSLPYLFDISVYNHLKDADLIDHIKRVGIVFYKRLDVTNNSNSAN